jgi:hypothetical protein
VTIEPAHAFYVWIKYVAIWDVESKSFKLPIEIGEGRSAYRSTVGGYECGRDVDRWAQGRSAISWIDFGGRIVSAKRNESVQSDGVARWLNRPNELDLITIRLLYRHDEIDRDNIDWSTVLQNGGGDGT